MTTLELVEPRLSEGRFASIEAFTDESLFQLAGVRIAFTKRQGGVSAAPYDSLNLGSHVGDSLSDVEENRRRVLAAFAAGQCPLIVPSQVHGGAVLRIEAGDSVADAQERSKEGFDSVVVGRPGLAAMLCFADCMPVIAVSPSGRFAVIHAGWRGVMAELAAKTVKEMCDADRAGGFPGDPAAMNVYIGPHIRSECFETSADVRDRFVARFGRSCAVGRRHVDLCTAQKTSLLRVGIDERRICDAGLCTVCENESFFSYRAQGGVCGRHGAFACRF